MLMNDHEKQNMKLRLAAISLIVIFSIFLAINLEKNYKIKNYTLNKTYEQQALYNSVYQSFKKRADLAYKLIRKNKELLGIYKDLQNADKKTKDILREKLSKTFRSTYYTLVKNGVEIFHFHTKNNESFLRFQSPYDYGDDLSKIRQTVVYVNRFKKPIDGFEIGKAFSGFRFVYPISDPVSTAHLGSVELSFDLELFAKEFMSTLNIFSNVMINKKIVDKKFNPSDIEEQYRTVLLPDYYALKDIDTLCDEDINKKYNGHLVNISTIKKGVKYTSQNQSISLFDDYSQNLITFIPIENPVTKENCGFITIRSNDKYIKNKDINTNFIFISLSLFVIGGAFFTYRETKREKDINTLLQKEVDKKTKELQEINETLEARVKKKLKENLQYKTSLYEKSKLASIGDMIANIAHQWRQPLANMSTIASSTIINKELGTLNDKQLIDNMEKIITKTKYLSETITTFRNYIKEDKQKNRDYTPRKDKSSGKYNRYHAKRQRYKPDTEYR